MTKNITTPYVLYEDNHLLAIYKPAGWLVQGDHTGDRTLTDWGKQYVAEKYNKPGAVFLHPAHRIDRPVRGAVLFARTSKALSRLTVLFKEKKVQKIYQAITLKAPSPPKGTLTHYLLKDTERNVTEVFPKPFRDAKESITRYETLRSLPNGRVLLQIFPETGRPHQIRAQMAAIGSPIEGDLKYGAPQALPNASIALCCCVMELQHPVQQTPLRIEAPGLADIS
jgi:23S rRNA pseudouridine1911/1915/1917 synthase